MRLITFLTLSLCLSLAACDAVQRQGLDTYMAIKKGLRPGDGPVLVESEHQNFEIRALTDDLDFPWGMAFLPDGRMLVTERPGKLRIFDIQSGESRMVEGLPAVFAKGQGGLLDVAVHPDFTKNQWIYLSYASKTMDGKATTRVARYRLAKAALEDELIVFQAKPAANASIHFGSALLFDANGLLYITVGDRKQRMLAQDPSTTLGKVIRIQADGSIPENNPFTGREDADGIVYSYGHRNPQGITRDPATGRIWTVEHGPRGGDEINLILPGANYGWPIITYGEEYGGGKIGEGTHKDGMEQPLHYYVPSIATGHIAWYDSTVLRGWTNSLFVAGLRSFSLSRVQLKDGEKVSEERLLEDFGFRLRNVKQGPDGFLYLLSENGGILQIRPAAR